MKHVYQAALGYKGLKEYPGSQHNPEVVKFFSDSGHDWVQDDETPWCAAFVGSVLAQCGISGTNKLNARSYLKWGSSTDINDANPGDVVVFWRGSKDSWKGHVAFYSHHDANNVYVLGGNQGNSVSIQAYPIDRVLDVRTMDQPRTSVAQSKTVQASVAQVAAAAGAGVTAVSALDSTVQMVVLVGAVVVAVTALVVLKERVLKWQSGVR